MFIKVKTLNGIVMINVAHVSSIEVGCVITRIVMNNNTVYTTADHIEFNTSGEVIGVSRR